jgi:hypothetical protein
MKGKNLRLFENKVVSRISALKTDETDGKLGIFYKEEVREIHSETWTLHVVRMDREVMQVTTLKSKKWLGI